MPCIVCFAGAERGTSARRQEHTACCCLDNESAADSFCGKSLRRDRAINGLSPLAWGAGGVGTCRRQRLIGENHDLTPSAGGCRLFITRVGSAEHGHDDTALVEDTSPIVVVFGSGTASFRSSLPVRTAQPQPDVGRLGSAHTAATANIKPGSKSQALKACRQVARLG